MTLDFSRIRPDCPSAITADKAAKCDTERRAMLAEIKRLSAVVDTLSPYVSRDFENRVATTAWNEAVEACAGELEDIANGVTPAEVSEELEAAVKVLLKLKRGQS